MLRRLVRTLVAVLVLIALVPVAWVQVDGRRGVVRHASAAPTAIVFGAGLKPDGSPSVYLTRRLQAALDLYRSGTVDSVLVSGDGVLPSHDEPTAMADWLSEHGVPDDAIQRDAEGVDTHATCVRAVDVFGIRQAVLITQDYHLPRAMFSCRAAGIDVQGVGVSATSVTPAQAVLWRAREVPASWKAWYEAMTHASA